MEQKIEAVVPSRRARQHLFVRRGTLVDLHLLYIMREFCTRFARFLAVSDKQSKIWAVHLLTSLLHNACQPKVTLLCCSVGVLYNHIASMVLQ